MNNNNKKNNINYQTTMNNKNVNSQKASLSFVGLIILVDF